MIKPDSKWSAALRIGLCLSFSTILMPPPLAQRSLAQPSFEAPESGCVDTPAGFNNPAATLEQRVPAKPQSMKRRLTGLQELTGLHKKDGHSPRN